MIYERRGEPLLSRAKFLARMVRHGILAGAIVAGSLLLGVFGYHLIEGLSWIDSLLNSAMLLGGMGPTSELHSTAGKLFASFYALYAGLIFLTVAGLLFAPVFHRIIHRFHLQPDSKNSTKP
jgi:hypothetical protein